MRFSSFGYLKTLFFAAQGNQITLQIPKLEAWRKLKYIVKYTILKYTLYYILYWNIYSEIYCGTGQSFKNMISILPLLKIAK